MNLRNVYICLITICLIGSNIQSAKPPIVINLFNVTLNLRAAYLPADKTDLLKNLRYRLFNTDYELKLGSNYLAGQVNNTDNYVLSRMGYLYNATGSVLSGNNLADLSLTNDNVVPKKTTVTIEPACTNCAVPQDTFGTITFWRTDSYLTIAYSKPFGVPPFVYYRFDLQKLWNARGSIPGYTDLGGSTFGLIIGIIVAVDNPIPDFQLTIEPGVAYYNCPTHRQCSDVDADYVSQQETIFYGADKYPNITQYLIDRGILERVEGMPIDFTPVTATPCQSTCGGS